MAMKLKCMKTGKEFPFGLNVFNNPDANDSKYSNLILEGGYRVEGFESLVPFKKMHISYGAGKTPLTPNKELASVLGLGNMLIKDESFNPYGTHKDRRSEYIINVAIENKVDKIVCLTAWNAGYSLWRYCSRAGVDYTSLIFPWVSKERSLSLKEWGEVISIDGARWNGILRPRDFKQIVEEYDKYERLKEWKHTWAVTNSFEPISINAYKELFYEVKAEQPDYIVVPCGSGDIIIGVWLAIQELWMNTKIIGVAPEKEHPLWYALKYGVDEYQIQNYSENSLAEKLTTPFTAVLPILYKIFTQEGNVYTEVSNEDISKIKGLVQKSGIKCENSAVVTFAAFVSNNRPNIDRNSKIIIVSTGKGLDN